MHHAVARPRLFAMALVLVVMAIAPAGASAASPSVVGSVSDPVNLSGIRTVAVSGHYVYTPSYYNGELTAIDISNPAAPVITGESAQSTAVSNADFITIAGGYAYVTSKNANASSSSNDNGTGDSLSIFDIHSNPAVPVLVGSVTDPTTLFGAYGVAVSGHYAFVTAQGSISGDPQTPNTGGNDFDVIDVSNPASPQIVQTITNPVSESLKHADSVTISGNYAYVTAAYSHTLTAIDISNPTASHIVGTLQDTTNLTFPNDVAVQGNDAYIANQTSPTGSVAVVDISNPASPHAVALLSSTQLDSAYRIVARGSSAYVAASRGDAITVVNVSNPTQPAVAGSVTDTAHLNFTTGLDFALTGRYIVAASPLLSSETRTSTPPYPLQGGPTNTGTVSVIDMDPNPVTVSVATPASGATYQKGQAVTAAYSCLPGGWFPVATCTGPVASGAALDTSTPGTHTFVVNGSDQDGQTGSATVSYTVLASPTAAFTYSPHTGLAGSSMSFDGSSSTDSNPGATITSYAWTFGDGKSASGAHVHHTYAKSGKYTVTLTVTDSVHQTSSVKHTVTVAKVTLTHVHQKNRTWRERGIRSKHRPPIGTVFSFVLNERANVTLTFFRLSPGRKSGKRCVAPTLRNRHRASCQIKTKAGTIRLKNLHGLNSIKFSGRIGRGYLRPGTYQLVIVATAHGQSTTATLTFTVVS